ncbi:MAG TPA: hypothetical protein VH437_15070 [Terriglobales bacterium]|jgi:hypothetical protein
MSHNLGVNSSSNDFATLDSTLNALYDLISGPAGEKRDWERYRSLFAPGARLMPVVHGSGDKPHVRLLSIDDYIQRVEPIFTLENFWERETSRKTEVFGSVAHVLSAYESLRNQNGEPFDRGANSIQLFNDGSRWWVVSIMWNTSRGE